MVLGPLWKESRSILVNVLILLLIFMVGIITVLFVSGLFGLLWNALVTYLGYANLTISDAISFFGNTNDLIGWFDAWIGYVSQKALDFINWLWSILQNNWPFAAAGGAAAGGAAAASSGGGGSGGSKPQFE